MDSRYKGTKDIHFGMVHSKFGVFDRKVTLIGSYNFDNISRGFNEEVAVVFEGEESPFILLIGFIIST